ncbi:MAG TPA: HAMP domain-containing sensor histidine kinase [Dehalococcoidia bacterium]
MRRLVQAVVARLLGFPLFYKVLVANSAIVVLGAALGTWLTARLVSGDQVTQVQLIAGFAVAGTVLSFLVNYVALRAAFRPLEALRRTAAAVRAGNLQARAPRVLFTDPDQEDLRQTFNTMLDELERQRAQLRSLSSQVMSAQEDERRRIARELHDGTAQALTSLLINLRLLADAPGAAPLQEQVGALREMVAATLEDVRRLARELRPVMLDDLGLADALSGYVQDLRRTVGLDVRLINRCTAERLPPQVELVLFRIAQEALGNVLKHAKATEVVVELACTAAEVRLEVRDNGRGFEVARALASRQRGLGLFGMQERAALVQGRLDLESRPGGGTVVRVVVPLGTGTAIYGEDTRVAG